MVIPSLQSSIVATPTPSREQLEAKTDKKTQTRNKRMFGVLLGTLQKFKENSTKEAARERKRKQIEKKLEEAAILEREEAIRKKKELFLARREQKIKLNELERKIEVAEMLEEWEDHDRKLSKFIRTNTRPHIFYLPAKHNDYTLSLLEKTGEHVEDEITKRRQEVAEILRKPEDYRQDNDADDEPVNESMVYEDDQEANFKEVVKHSEDMGNNRRRVVRRRQVVLTSKTKESKSKDDEMEEMNDVENSKNEEFKNAVREENLVESGETGVQMRNVKVKVEDEDVGKSMQNEGKEVAVKHSELSERKDEDNKSRVEAEKIEEEEMEVDKVEESEVAAGKLEADKVEEMGMQEDKVETTMKEMDAEKLLKNEVHEEEIEKSKMGVEEIQTSKIRAEKMLDEESTQENVTGDTVVSRQPAGGPLEYTETALIAKESEQAPTDNHKEMKSMQLAVQKTDVQLNRNEVLQGDSELNETESKVLVDPEHANE